MDIFRVSDAELLRRVDSFEDSFGKRNSLNDTKEDVVKTCVAFANTCDAEGAPGILFYGMRNDGAIEDLSDNVADSMQKTIRDQLSVIYPPIEYKTREIRKADQKLLAIIVPGSAKGPHFSGPA